MINFFISQGQKYLSNLQIMTSGWTTTYHFGCVLPDYSMNPEALRMLRFMWWTIILKLLELLETVFFLLRKKERQASFLHVYHHVSTLVIIWLGTKYIGGKIIMQTIFFPEQRAITVRWGVRVIWHKLLSEQIMEWMNDTFNICFNVELLPIGLKCLLILTR